MNVVIGLDPGKQVDPAALVVAERQVVAPAEPGGREGDRWVIRHAQQWELGTPHTTVLEDALALFVSTGGDLVFERNNAGEVYLDLIRMLKKAGRIDRNPFPVLTTGGSSESGLTVSKDRLARAYEAKLTSGRIVVAAGCPLAAVLRRQHERFGYEITRHGNATYEAMREKDHDDLLLAAMFATHWRRSLPSGPRALGNDGVVYDSVEAAVAIGGAAAWY